MSDGIKYYSDIEKYEIININDGEKYSVLSNNDIIVDEAGNMKSLILGNNKSGFSLFAKSEFFEVPWEYIKKIGARTIIIDVEDSVIKKNRL
ncbi:YlmC/YmxH family sporulation protein [Clostridium hydrogenum]|uniref:YlmC/YmxH family sporulation protein n=1 Tax=Clostridium hydrogenum TaxID=2855764 RepID=UPI001F491663|nr:YlmC/YmxH family sporulation protein [Clostridium hydrogenum]